MKTSHEQFLRWFPLRDSHFRSARRGSSARVAIMAAVAFSCGLPGVVSGQEDRSEQQPPAGVNPMQALAQPSGQGRTGPRIFHRPGFDTGHVAWVAVAALGSVLIAPGWMFFYGGRLGKCVPSRAGGQIFLLAAVLSLGWGLITYSLAFGFNWGAENAPESELVGIDGQFTGIPLIGGTGNMALRGLEPDVAADEREYPLRRRQDSIPHMLFMGFQMFVAMIAPVPLVVVLSNRLRTGPLVCAAVGWSALVYVPLAHWMWGFGWLRHAGALDFGGGAVLQMAAGFSALGVLPWLPPRPAAAAAPEHSGFCCLGGALLWAGSLFLIGGSAHAAGPSAVAALLCAHVAACAGAMGWAVTTWLKEGRATVGDLAAGAASGLAAIAAGSGFIALQSALVIGLAGGIVCRAACAALAAHREREILMVFGIQGVGGCLGMVLTGVFASSNFAGSSDSGRLIEGLLSGDVTQLRLQAIAALAAAVVAPAGSLLVFGIVRRLSPGGWSHSDKPEDGPPEERPLSDAISA